MRLKVALLCGGQSTEHKVSLLSARNIFRAIDQNRFEAYLVGIDIDGNWHIHDHDEDFFIDADDPEHIRFRHFETPNYFLNLSQHPKTFLGDPSHPPLQFDVIFPIIHGTKGEDGAIQGLCRFLNIPCVGSDIVSSSICFDKDLTKRILQSEGVAIAPFKTLFQQAPQQEVFEQLKQQLGLPLYIKPASQGSSVGISKVENWEEFQTALQLAFRYSAKVLVEQTMIGREIECAVLGNGDEIQVSVCGEIISHQTFYTYESKYLDSTSAKIIIPAPLATEIEEEIRQTAVKVYRLLGCADLARVDFFLTEDHQVIINEVNTLPGFTNSSMYPKLWEHQGMSQTELVTQLIMGAMQTSAQWNRTQVSH